jgi:DNA-binding transcriptional LysR family regulator
MDIRRLKTFVTVADQGTVSKAASLLHTTQPALSRQIASLEQELGFKLFGRVGRRLVLTTRGQQLVADCRTVLSKVDALAEQARSLRQGDMKVMRIAASSLTIEGLFAPMLNDRCECGHGMKVKLIEANAGEHLGMLERGEADLSVNVLNDLYVDDALFGTYPLPEFHVIGACAPNFDIDHVDSIDVRRIANYPLLLLKKEYATRAVFDSACRLANVKPTAVVESVSAHGLLGLAETGQGIAIVPSILPTERWKVRTMSVMQRRQLLRISLGVLWDRRRMLASHAESCGEIIANNVRKLFPQKMRDVA